MFQAMYAPGTKVYVSNIDGWLPGTVNYVASSAIYVSHSAGKTAASSSEILVSFKLCRIGLAYATDDGCPKHATTEVRLTNH